MDRNFNLDPSADNYCVMGNPISHSKSPQIHHAFAEQTGENIYYQSILVNKGGFPEALAQFQRAGGKGLNITIPFKGDAWAAVDQRTARAEQARAVNTIWFAEDGARHGDTTDGIGLVRDLLHHQVDIENSDILVIGAGGAVRGLLGPLGEASPARIMLVNRTAAKAESLITQFAEYKNLGCCDFEALATETFDIVINGTSASLQGELPPLPDTLLKTNACCYDMVYGESDTIFVQWARKHGAKIALDGLGMLVEQAAESFHIWRGVRPETEPVIEMLRHKF